MAIAGREKLFLMPDLAVDLGSALALLVTRVGLTDDHDAPVPPDDPAVVADPLDARLDLHGLP